MNTTSWMQGSRRITIALCAFFSAAFHNAQELRITNYGFDAERRFQVQFSSGPESYCILFRGDTPGQVTNPLALKTGISGVALLGETQSALSTQARSFPRAASARRGAAGLGWRWNR